MSDDLMRNLQEVVRLLQSAQFDEAVSGCDRAVAKFPSHPELLHLRAVALGKLGRIEEAVRDFDAAAGRHPQAHAVFGNKGNALQANGNTEAAIEAYQAAISRDPNFLNGWIGLGAAFRQNGQEAKAEEALRRALDLSPNNPAVLNNLGASLSTQDRKEEAITLFSAALSARPDMINALINRAAARRELGDLARAQADLERAVALNPQHPEAHYQFASLRRALGDEEGAARAFETALSLAPRRADIHRDYARYLWESGAHDRYLSTLEAALARHPDAGLATLAAELALQAKDVSRAFETARRAVELDPASPQARAVLARVQLAMRDASASISTFEMAFALAPDNDDIRLEFAEALISTGDTDKALTILADDPPHAFLQRHIALKATAMRLSGDKGYERYYDYERFVSKMILSPPTGYASIDKFNAQLAETIIALHDSKTAPIDQTLFGGTQSLGRLWRESAPVVQTFAHMMMDAAKNYVAMLPDDDDHPFLAIKHAELSCNGAWSVILSAGGGHIDHFHPAGWVSAVYYVKVPPEVGQNDHSAGYLRLGRPGIPGVSLEAEKWVQPEEGAVVFFPSYMWHGVETFDSTVRRITAPFDIIPILSPC